MFNRLDGSVKKAILFSLLAHALVIVVVYVGSVFTAEKDPVTFKPFIEAKLVGAVPKIDKKPVVKEPRKVNEELQKKQQERKQQEEKQRLQRERQKRLQQEQERAAQQERIAQQKALDLKKQQEKEQKEREEKQLAEKKRLEEIERKKKEEAERKEKQRQEKERLAREKKEREKKEQERKERLEKERKEKERKEKELADLEAQLEADLFDSELSDVRQSVVLTKVEEIQAKIQQKVYRYWRVPDTIGECKVSFAIGPGGIIVEISKAVGQDDYCESGQMAIRDAEPLPYSNDPEVRAYLREVSITFKPLK